MFEILRPYTTGELLVHTIGVTPGSRILYGQETFVAPLTLSIGPTVTGDGEYLLTGLSPYSWYSVTIEGELEIKRAKPIATDRYYGITLVRESLETYVVGRTVAYRLKVTAQDPVNMSAKIFLYERATINDLTGETRDNFIAVCKPGDLDVFPEDDPGTGIEPPYFRLDNIDIVEANIELMEEYWTVIVRCKQELLDGLENLRDLTLGEIV